MILLLHRITFQQLSAVHLYLCANCFAKCAIKLFRNTNAVGRSLIRDIYEKIWTPTSVIFYSPYNILNLVAHLAKQLGAIQNYLHFLSLRSTFQECNLSFVNYVMAFFFTQICIQTIRYFFSTMNMLPKSYQIIYISCYPSPSNETLSHTWKMQIFLDGPLAPRQTLQTQGMQHKVPGNPLSLVH